MSAGYEALRNGAGLLDLAGRGLLRVTGRDRVRLLHNLTSNDVKALAPGHGCYAFLLSPQGRIQADLWLFCFEDRFLIDTEPELREKAAQHIRKYIIADQVELADVSGELAAVAVEGPAAAAVLAAAGAPVPGAAGTHLAWRDATVAAVSFTGQPGFRVYAPAARREESLRLLAAAGARPASQEEARTVRIEQGKPRYGEEIADTSLPQETQQMHAVSFQKGCYLGQEIVERIRARGHVNRKLVALEIESAAAPPPGTRLATAAAAEAGEIASAVYSPLFRKVAALAWVRAPYDAPGTALRAGDAPASVR